jgi:hypothetical protein
MKAGSYEEAEAAVCQQMKVLLQVAIDRGDWTNATLLSPHTDPLHTESFGGEEREMRSVVNYQKALKELKAKVVIGSGDAGEEPGAGDTDELAPAGSFMRRNRLKMAAAKKAASDKAAADKAAAAKAAPG